MLAGPPVRRRSRSLIRLEPLVTGIRKDSGKDEYDHYMKKEIHEQPESLAMTAQGRTKKRAGDGTAPAHSYVLLGGLQPLIPAILSSRRLIFIGAGSSYHACLAVQTLMETMSGVPVALERASDFADRRGPVFRDDICFFVSQSGETADTLQALEYAQSLGAMCLGITNGVSSTLARKTEAGVYLHAGEEIGVASTKTYTSQVLALTLVALALGQNSRAAQPQVQATIAALADLPATVAAALQLSDTMQSLARTLMAQRSLLFFGRGSVGFATTLEAAHKMKEVAQMHSEGILAGEMKHGPLALVDESTPCFVIALRDGMHSKMLSVLQQLVARRGRLIVLCTCGDEAVREVMRDAVDAVVLEVPPIASPLHAIVSIVPFQLLSYHMTVAKRLNVDQPRNLAKSYSNSGY